jgi:hypothetical protein
MHLPSKHIVTIGRILSILLFLSIPGFTAVLYLCCHPVHTDHHENSSTHGDSHSDSHAHDCSIPAPSDYATVSDQCHTTKIAGGLNTIPALLEKDNKTQARKVESSFTLSSFDISSPLLALTSGSHSPPAVEKFVLSHAYLI